MKIASMLAASCCAALNICMGKGAHVSANFSNMPDETMCMEVNTLCDNTTCMQMEFILTYDRVK